MARLSISITVDNFATQTTRRIDQILCRGNVTHRDLSLERHLYEEITGKQFENRRVAPLLAATQNSENQHWILAELVRFTPGMNDVFLTQVPFSEQHDSRDGAQQLLNECLEGYTVEAVNGAPHLFLIGSKKPIDIETRDTSAALGQPLSSVLPTGPSATFWNSKINEMQMMFHELTHQREVDRNKFPNGVWFWGNGHSESPFVSTVQVSPSCALARALASASNASEIKIEDYFRAETIIKPTFIDLCDLDLNQHENALEKILQHAVMSLNKGTLTQFRFNICRPNKVTRIDINRYSKWKIWRKSSRLNDLMREVSDG